MRKVIYILLSITIMVAAFAALVGPRVMEARTADYKPVYAEGYTYGDVDELRMRLIYQVSNTDEAFDLPVGDFEYNGRMYHLISLDRTDELDLDSYTKDQIGYDKDLIFYTATFGSKEI